MIPSKIHSYLLWRSSVEPAPDKLASRRLTASVSLIPALMCGLLVFGWYAGLVVGLAITSALITDLIAQKFQGRWIFNNEQSTRDFTWLLSGLLIGLLLPPDVPLWIPILGGAVAILVGKHWWAVDDMPWLQPAAVALLVLHVACFVWMHPKDANGTPKWPVLARPLTHQGAQGQGVGSAVRDLLGGNINLSISKDEYNRQLSEGRHPQTPSGEVAEAYYGPRALDVAADSSLEGQNAFRMDAGQFWLGYMPGPIGGTSALALALGILLIVFTGAAAWITPLCALATLCLGMYLVDGANVWTHLFSGYTLLAFFYLAADPTTLARSTWGKVLAGVAVGLLEVILRFTPLAEGTFISVLCVQGLAYFIDLKWAPPKESSAQESSAHLRGLSRL